MLQTIRERAQGWIAWAIVLLISIPFALWGIQSYLGVGSEPVAAKVNGVEITQRELDRRYQQTRMQLREQLGDAYRPELFDERSMRAQVLDQMIQERLMLQVSHEMGLRASNQELRTAIMSNPAFQKDGRFDKATYDRMLELQGTLGSQFEEGLRQRLVGTQLQRAVAASAFITEAELDEAVRIDRQQRELTFVRLPREAFREESPPAEADVEAYYEAHRDRYQSPERVKISYLVLDAKGIDTGQTVDDEELRRRYEEELERFRQPERRRARHLLITLETDANEQAAAEAKARIEEIRGRILAGGEFGELAEQFSEDPGSASQGGDLGLFGQGLMDPAFDQAAFTLEKGELSEPVRSQFGYHLIQVTEIEPGALKRFEEVRDQLARESNKSSAEGLYYDWAERLANLTYENPDSLEPAAEALGIPLQTSDWIERGGGEGLLANPRVLAAAFSDEVLKDGLNSELVEPERDVLQAIVLRVLEHEEAAPKPLDAVRDQIVEALRDERAAAAAKAAADALLARLDAGEDLRAVAGDYALAEAGLVGRDSAEVPQGVRELAFKLPRPAEGAASFGSLALADGDAAVVKVARVVDGALGTLSQAERAQAERELERLLGASYYEELLADLMRRADIERKPIEASTGL
jgi:peptidyl-prolyl cis-trans isomerase D